MAIRLVSFVILFFGISTVQGQAPAKHTRKSLQEFYMKYLKDEGYKAEVDADGDIKMKVEGFDYYIYIYENNPAFFAMSLPLRTLDDKDDRDKVLAAANEATRDTSIAKVYLNKNNVVVAVQQLMTKPEDVKAIFPTIMDRMQAARRKFEREAALLPAKK